VSRGASDTPRNLVERAADKGLEAIKAELAHADATLERALVLVVADKVPTGEADAATTGSGVEDAHELIALLASHLISAGRQIGLQVELVPFEKIGGDS
jgi:hypothetical protein